MKTVSNVIHDHPYVTEATRSSVLAAIDQVGYRPNLSARNLARGRSGVIALVVPRLEMPYFAALASLIVEKAEARGWFVLIQQTGGDPQVERRALEGRFPQRIDGLIISAEGLTAQDLESRTDRTPLVMLGDLDFGEHAHHVGIDNTAASRLAVEHLLSSGRRRIAMIGSRQGGGPPESRTAGYLAALHGAGLDVPAELMRTVAANSGEEGQRAVQELLDEVAERPDGIFAVTDWVALGAVRELRSRGLDVPSDVAVVGFDDIPYTRVSSPSLTTITPDRTVVAEQAISILDAQIRGAASLQEPTTVRAPFSLSVRESAP